MSLFWGLPTNTTGLTRFVSTRLRSLGWQTASGLSRWQDVPTKPLSRRSLLAAETNRTNGRIAPCNRSPLEGRPAAGGGRGGRGPCLERLRHDRARRVGRVRVRVQRSEVRGPVQLDRECGGGAGERRRPGGGRPAHRPDHDIRSRPSAGVAQTRVDILAEVGETGSEALAVARADLRSLEAYRELGEHIVSPFAGTVTRQGLLPGQAVTVGREVAAVRGPGGGSVDVVGLVAHSDAVRIEPGMNARAVTSFDSDDEGGTRDAGCDSCRCLRTGGAATGLAYRPRRQCDSAARAPGETAVGGLARPADRGRPALPPSHHRWPRPPGPTCCPVVRRWHPVAGETVTPTSRRSGSGTASGHGPERSGDIDSYAAVSPTRGPPSAGRPAWASVLAHFGRWGPPPRSCARTCAVKPRTEATAP